MISLLFNNTFIFILFTALPVMMLMNIITEWFVSVINNEPTENSIASYLRKILSLLALIAFIGADLMIYAGLQYFNVPSVSIGFYDFATKPLFTLTVLIWLTIAEFLSIFSNLKEAGVSLPTWITIFVEKVRDKLDNGEK